MAILVSAQKMSKKLGNEFCNECRKEGFKNVYQITYITKLRNFQLRVLHNMIYCNNVLYHWKKVNTQQCDYCTFEKQVMCHLLWKCNKSQSLWKMLKNLGSKYHVELELNLANVLYNVIARPNSNIFNFLTLVTKFYIYRCKCQQKQPSYEVLKKEYILYYEMEKYIAMKVNKYAKFKRKWSPVQHILDKKE